MQWLLWGTLPVLFWASELIVLILVLAPPILFLNGGWNVRKQEFVNRLKGKNISVYLALLWQKVVGSGSFRIPESVLE